jgi:hypothetical protein
MILDYAGLDAIIGREPGKRRPERIPVSEAKQDQSQADSAWMSPDLISVPEEEWQAAVERFEILKPLITMDRAKRTLWFPCGQTAGAKTWAAAGAGRPA